MRYGYEVFGCGSNTILLSSSSPLLRTKPLSNLPFSEA
nr:MAG TPA: hypothetical protein [Caudoviricetes sp.]